MATGPPTPPQPARINQLEETMTTRCNPLARASALLVLILALFAIPSSTRAQDACRCDYTTIAVESDVNCKVTICYQLSPDSRPICIVIEPGTKVRIPCPVYEADIVTCSGNYPVISNSPVIARCTPSLSVPGFCCVRACRGADVNGCPLVTISAASCLGRPCP
jgi:hypothetical protein